MESKTYIFNKQKFDKKQSNKKDLKNTKKNK